MSSLQTCLKQIYQGVNLWCLRERKIAGRESSRKSHPIYPWINDSNKWIAGGSFLCLPGAPFFGFCLKQHLFWSLLRKNVAASQKRSCSKWSRIARMKGNQQTCCRWQWCHSWSIGNKVDWHGLDGLWALDLQPFVPFHCDSDISKTTKTIRNWGTGKNAFVSGRNAFVSGRNAFVLVQSAVTKIVLPRRPINKR